MSKFVYWYEGLVFILIYMTIVGISCAALTYFGLKLINNIGQFPSQSAKFQMQAALPLSGIIIGSFILFALFFHVFSD